jgi:glutaryl-CoA dehydrogenase
MMSVQSSLVMYPIMPTARGAAQKYLPKLATGEWIGCFGLTEPDAGSDPGGMKTRAEKVPGGYRSPAPRCGSPTRPIADVFVVWAKSDRCTDQIRGFVLEKGMKGLSAPKIGGKLSLRASITGEIVMDDVVFVPEDALLPNVPASRARSAASTAPATASPGARWAPPRFCWHTRAAIHLDRKQFGRPLAANQLIQKKLADMQTEITLGLQGCAARRAAEGRGPMAPR